MYVISWVFESVGISMEEAADGKSNVTLESLLEVHIILQ